MTTEAPKRPLSSAPDTHTYNKAAMTRTLAHYAWHRESDSWKFYIALDADGGVVSAYAAAEVGAPGTVIDWFACNALEQLAADMTAGRFHAMGGQPCQWPPSILKEIQ